MQTVFFDDYSSIEEQIEKSSKPLETITRKQLVSILDYMNFKENTVIINLRHIRYGNTLSLEAYPLVYSEEFVRCVWVNKPLVHDIDTAYEFVNLVIDRNVSIIVVKANVRQITVEHIDLFLPETCEVVLLRRTKRHLSSGVDVEVFQNGVLFRGTLIDFSTVAFKAVVTPVAPATFNLLDANVPVYVVFKRNNEIVFSGECHILKHSQGKRERVLVLSYDPSKVQGLNDSRFKSKGQVLKPPPAVVFVHPLTNKLTRLDVEELATTWFSVIEDEKNAVLFAGLVIPELKIEITPLQTITCRAQVAHKAKDFEESEGSLKWRVIILDMSPYEQIKLASLLGRAEDRRSYVCAEVDLEALFDFFFSSGFIYHDKYLSLAPYKEKFIETYRRLYLEALPIAKHFIYQEKGKILGHVSMLRFYENTWLVQHLAATGQHFAGIMVLRQVAHYIHDCSQFYSSHMDYVICYYRPDNKFPNRIFGGIAAELKNPKMCSVDTLAYLELAKKDCLNNFKNSNKNTIVEITPEDLIELKSFYEHVSQGLLIDALDLAPEMLGIDNLNSEYKTYGFKRERKLFALKKDKVLYAIIVQTKSDVGLNMSNLTNCLQVFVIKKELMPEELFSALALLSCYYEEEKIPVLIFPLNYAKDCGISYKREYNLWCLNTSHRDQFLKCIEQLFSWVTRFERQF